MNRQGRPVWQAAAAFAGKFWRGLPTVEKQGTERGGCRKSMRHAAVHLPLSRGEVWTDDKNIRKAGLHKRVLLCKPVFDLVKKIISYKVLILNWKFGQNRVLAAVFLDSFSVI